MAEIVEYILRVRNEAEAPLEATAKAAKDLNTTLKSTEVEADKANKSLGKEVGVGQKAGQAKEGIAQLGGAISVLSPQLGAMVMTVGQLGGALKGGSVLMDIFGVSTAGASVSMGLMAAVAAPLVLALGALALVYADVSREQRISEELTAAEKAARESLIPSVRKLEDAMLDLQVATGIYNAEQEASIRLQMTAQRSVLDFAKSQETQRKALDESVASAETWKGVLDKTVSVLSYTPLGLVGSMTGINDAFKEGVMSVTGMSDTLGGYREKVQILDDALTGQALIEKQLKTIHEETTKATEAHTKATEAQTEAVKEATKAAKGYLDASLLMVSLPATPTSFKLPSSGVSLGSGPTVSQGFSVGSGAEVGIELGKAVTEASATFGENLVSEMTPILSGISGVLSGGLDGVANMIGEMGGAWGKMIQMVWQIISKGADMADKMTQQLKDLPGAIERLPQALEDLYHEIWDSLPEIGGALGEAVAQMIVDALSWETLEETVTGLIESILSSLDTIFVDIIWGLIKELGDLLETLWEKIIHFFGGKTEEEGGNKNLKGFVSGGLSNIYGALKGDAGKTDSYGDTPSLMRATGNTVRFAPGDYFAAARTKEGVARQVSGFGGGGTTINVSTSVLTADGARELQRVFQRYNGIYPSAMGTR